LTIAEENVSMFCTNILMRNAALNILHECNFVLKTVTLNESLHCYTI